MRILGPIIRLQVQRSTLKTGEKPLRRYDPSAILTADRLRIGPDGAVALVNGQEVVDVHNRHHPATKNEDGLHGLSVGFTAHYRAMQDRYGKHLVLGCAGENILVENDRRIEPAEVAQGLAILAPDGTERLRLPAARVAHPCKPFSGFAHRHATVEPDVLKATLQFLDDGMRGYYC